MYAIAPSKISRSNANSGYLPRLSTVNSLRKYAVLATKLPKVSWLAVAQLLSLKPSVFHLAAGAFAPL